MPEPTRPPLRRADDARFDDFVRKLERIENKVDELRDTLADPDRTVLGRQLVQRANINAANIEKHAERIDRLESWQDQMKGSAAFVRMVQVVLGIIVGLLTLYVASIR